MSLQTRKLQDEGELGAEVMRVTGIFDVPAAWSLCEKLRRVRPRRNVLLDFSEVTEVHDFALAALFHGISRSSAQSLRTRGLCPRHNRLIRFLGASWGSSDS